MPPDRRSSWSAFGDQWSPNDPAVRRMHDALSQAAPEAPGRAERPEADTGSCDPPPAAAATSRRERIAALVGRIRSGDLSAVEALRRLIE